MFYIIRSTPTTRSSDLPFGYRTRQASAQVVSPEEQYYRRIAEQHEQYARLALARARQEEEHHIRRAAFVREQGRLRREEEFYSSIDSFHPFFPQEEYRPVAAPHHLESPFGLDLHLRLERERRVKEALLARRQREQDETRRLQFIAERSARLRASDHERQQRQAVEEMVSSLLGLVSTEAKQEPTGSTPPLESKPTSPCKSRCSQQPDHDDLWGKLLSDFFGGLASDPTEDHPQSSSCAGGACKRASTPTASAPPHAQTAPASNGKGKGKAASIPSTESSTWVNQVGGYVFPLGLSAQEKQEIMSALDITPTPSSSQKPAASASAPPTPKVTVPVANPVRRPSSLSSLSAIETKFDGLKTSFDFPTNVDFIATSSARDNAGDSATSTPTLAFTSNNLQVNKYENDLNELLTQLDGVESNGEDQVREKRRSLVVAVEAELETLDLKKAKAWSLRTQSNADASPAADAGPLASDTDVHELESTEADVPVALTSDTTTPSPPGSPVQDHAQQPSEPSILPPVDAVVEESVIEQEAASSYASSDSESDAEEFAALLRESATEKMLAGPKDEQVEVKGYELI